MYKYPFLDPNLSSNLYIINDNTFFKSNLANSVLNGSSSLSGLIDPMSYEVIDPINEIYKKVNLSITLKIK